MDIYVHRRRLNLIDTKPGALIEEGFPKMILVRMLKRPKYFAADLVFSLRGKFNTILEERLNDGVADNHRIMSIEVNEEDFDYSGGLNSDGQKTFWREIDNAIKKFNVNTISLLPRKQQQEKKKAEIKNLVPRILNPELTGRKLPTPPLRYGSDSNRRSSKGHSKPRYKRSRSRSRSTSATSKRKRHCDNRYRSHSGNEDTGNTITLIVIIKYLVAF